MTCPYFNECLHYDPNRFMKGLFLWAIVSAVVLVIEVFWRKKRP